MIKAFILIFGCIVCVCIAFAIKAASFLDEDLGDYYDTKPDPFFSEPDEKGGEEP